MHFEALSLKRLQELIKQRPQFSELLGFYQTLYGFFLTQDQPLLALLVDSDNAAERAKKGVPLLTAESLSFDRPRLDEFLDGLLELLVAHSQQGQTSLGLLQKALANHTIDVEDLLKACFERRRDVLVETADNLGIEPAILAYVFEMALSFALRGVTAHLQKSPPPAWREGICPTCGGVPAMAELCSAEGERRLHCGTCATSWHFPRQTCPYCGNQEKEAKEYFTAGDERGYRVDLCRKCNCYLKTVDGRELGEGLPMDIEDVVTLPLDILAQREGFSQGKKPLA
jgi:FdhE protein